MFNKTRPDLALHDEGNWIALSPIAHVHTYESEGKRLTDIFHLMSKKWTRTTHDLQTGAIEQQPERRINKAMLKELQAHLGARARTL